MILTMLGTIDMRSFMGIDDRPFAKSTIFSQKPSSEGRLPVDRAIPGIEAFVSELEAALMCQWDRITFEKTEPSFPIIPLLGNGIELHLPPSGQFARHWKSAALSISNSEAWGRYEYVEIEDEPGTPLQTHNFDPVLAAKILEEATLSPTLWVTSPGFISLQIDVESSDPAFVHYWYPLTYALEAATYSQASLNSCHTGKPDELELNASKVKHRGEINSALLKLRECLSLHLGSTIPREVPDFQRDELETGLFSILRCTVDDPWEVALKVATAHNEYTALTPIRSDPYTTYLGWTAACIVVRHRDGESEEDAKAVYNARLSILIYNLYFFYERYLSVLFAQYVYLDNTFLPRSVLNSQRRFGEAILYLADLRRASQYGSDRRFFDAWIKISDLDNLRKKTADGLQQILNNLEERQKRQIAHWARWFGYLTFMIGLSSILGWVNSLESYFTTSTGKVAPPEVFTMIYGTSLGIYLLVVYGVVLAIFGILYFALLLVHIRKPPIALPIKIARWFKW
jgi:hypothetical protein